MFHLLNKIFSQTSMLLMIFAGLVGSVVAMNFAQINPSDVVILLIGAFIKTFLDAAYSKVKTDNKILEKQVDNTIFTEPQNNLKTFQELLEKSESTENVLNLKD